MIDPLTGASPGDRPYVDADSGEASLRGQMGLGKNQDRPRSTPTLPQAAPPPSAASPAAPSASPASSVPPTGAATGVRSGLLTPQLDDWAASMWQQLGQQQGAPEYLQRIAQLAAQLRGGQGG